MMQSTLFNAYTPLIIWTGLGLILFRFLPYIFPRLLGIILYWVGVPLEILALSHQNHYISNYKYFIGRFDLSLDMFKNNSKNN